MNRTKQQRVADAASLMMVFTIPRDEAMRRRAPHLVYYVGAIFMEYAVAFSLAILLNADRKIRKLVRIASLLAFMLRPVAVS
jgi:hypothetical protein